MSSYLKVGNTKRTLSEAQVIALWDTRIKTNGNDYIIRNAAGPFVAIESRKHMTRLYIAANSRLFAPLFDMVDR